MEITKTEQFDNLIIYYVSPPVIDGELAPADKFNRPPVKPKNLQIMYKQPTNRNLGGTFINKSNSPVIIGSGRKFKIKNDSNVIDKKPKTILPKTKFMTVKKEVVDARLQTVIQMPPLPIKGVKKKVLLNTNEKNNITAVLKKPAFLKKGR
ncbi:MAG: hypothetical protein WC783_01025 [Candidatus Paceibacterota bacterium]|jgi:hypothetical protein